MAVLKSERHESKLTVILKAQEVVKYTLQITANEKHFPKRHRWQLTAKIVNAALEMAELVTKANAIRAIDEATKSKRNMDQEEAYAASEWLLTAIDIAFAIFPVSSSTAEYWTGLVVEFQRSLRAWQRSDKERWNRDAE